MAYSEPQNGVEIANPVERISLTFQHKRATLGEGEGWQQPPSEGTHVIFRPNFSGKN